MEAAVGVAKEDSNVKAVKRLPKPPRVALTSVAVWMTPKLAFAAWKRRKLSRPSKRIPFWNVPTKMWKSATTLMSLNSLPLKRKFATKTLRKLAKSLSSNKPLKKQSRSATSPWKRSATDKERRNVELFTNLPVPLVTSKNNQVKN